MQRFFIGMKHDKQEFGKKIAQNVKNVFAALTVAKKKCFFATQDLEKRSSRENCGRFAHIADYGP